MYIKNYLYQYSNKQTTELKQFGIIGFIPYNYVLYKTELGVIVVPVNHHIKPLFTDDDSQLINCIELAGNEASEYTVRPQSIVRIDTTEPEIYTTRDYKGEYPIRTFACGINIGSIHQQLKLVGDDIPEYDDKAKLAKRLLYIARYHKAEIIAFDGHKLFDRYFLIADNQLKLLTGINQLTSYISSISGEVSYAVLNGSLDPSVCWSMEWEAPFSLPEALMLLDDTCVESRAVFRISALIALVYGVNLFDGINAIEICMRLIGQPYWWNDAINQLKLQYNNERFFDLLMHGLAQDYKNRPSYDELIDGLISAIEYSS